MVVRKMSRSLNLHRGTLYSNFATPNKYFYNQKEKEKETVGVCGIIFCPEIPRSEVLIGFQPGFHLLAGETI